MLHVKTPQEVISIIKTEFPPLTEQTEYVPFTEAFGRVLSEDIIANEYVPGFDRSTVDGYALRAEETFGCSDAMPAILELDGEVLMGKDGGKDLPAGSLRPVPTGGAIPGGANSVVMIEYTENYGDGTVGVGKPAAPGSNIIFKGDDVYPGKVVLSRGRTIGVHETGVLASIGCVNVPVSKKLRVAIISTGDELIHPEETPADGQIRDVNSYMLEALMRSWGAEPVNFGILRDDPAQIEAAVEEALVTCDAVLLSGGSSVGVKDAACRIIEDLGELLFHGIAIKPGKPTIMGKCRNKPVIGLPGHPAAAYFIARLFVLPLLSQLSGKRTVEYKVKAVLSESVNANHGREQYLACRLEERPGGLTAIPIWSKSGLITQLSAADGFFCIERDCEGLSQGTEIEVTVNGF